MPDRKPNEDPDAPEMQTNRPTGGATPQFDTDTTDATPVRGRGTTTPQKPTGGGPAQIDTPAKKPKTGLIALAAIAAIIGVASFFAFKGPVPATEQNTPNWKYVEKANQDNDAKFKSSKAAEVTVEQVTKAQVASLVTSIGISAADRNANDEKITADVKAAIQSGNPQQLQTVLQAAVSEVPAMPAGKTDPQGQPIVQKAPQLSQGMTQAVLSGDAEFVHIFLFDSCQEDGDVVDVILDGTLFCTVPLTIKGATVSVPINTKHPTQISLRGVYDGGGGVTVGVRSSIGDFFVRSMYVGETQMLGIARQ